MATLYTQQESNTRKTWLLMLVFLVFIVFLGWFISYVYNEPAILFVAVLFSIFMNIFSYWYSDKIILKMYRAQEISDTSHPDLYNIVENLSITAGLPMPKVYVIPDAVPNAFATGRNKNHSAVAVTAGLLKILDRSELEGVIAHELAHIGNKDILLSTVVVILVGFIVLISDMFVRMSFFRGDRNDRGNVGAILMIIGVIFVIISPIVATIIQLAISRKREFLADASGAMLTRYPEGLARALQKISSVDVSMNRANHATAHLFISNPFGGESARGFMTKLFRTHPPVEDRIKALLEHR